MEACNRRVWAIRGATTVSSDDPALIDEAVGELLSLIYKENNFSEENVVFTLFSQTSDLGAAMPPLQQEETVSPPILLSSVSRRLR